MQLYVNLADNTGGIGGAAQGSGEGVGGVVVQFGGVVFGKVGAPVAFGGVPQAMTAVVVPGGVGVLLLRGEFAQQIGAIVVVQAQETRTEICGEGEAKVRIGEGEAARVVGVRQVDGEGGARHRNLGASSILIYRQNEFVFL